MLVWLDESVLTADLASNQSACHGITELFNAVYRGDHFVLGRRATLRQLAQNESLSSATRSVIATTESNFAQFGRLIEVFSRKLTVTYGKSHGIKRCEADQWEISLDQVASDAVNKSVLLAENLRDCDVYKYAAEHYRISESLAPCAIKIELSGGGGSTTPDALQNLTVNEHRWCLCITDSDRFSPHDGLSLNAQKCREIADDGLFVVKHINLLVREIENLIPLGLLEQAMPHEHADAWSWHRDQLMGVCPDIHDYCDLKEGTSLAKILREPEGSPRREFWTIHVSTLRLASLVALPCEDANQCGEPDKACSCMVTNGFGKVLLKSVIAHLKNCSPHSSLKNIANDPKRDEWLSMGREVLDWACAPPDRVRS